MIFCVELCCVSYSAVLFEVFLISVVGTKSVEGEVSDGGGGRVSDTDGSGECGCSNGGGGVSGVGQGDGIVADAGVVLADAGEGGIHGLCVR
jgi:hypothetical protein